METDKPLPSPKGPLEGSGDPPEVRPPDDAVVIGDDAAIAKAASAERRAGASDEGKRDTDSGLGDKARTWMADKIAPDNVELVPKSPADDDPDGAASGE